MSKLDNNDHTTTDRLSERARESLDQFAKTSANAEQRIRNEAAGAGARVREAGQKTREQSDDTLQYISAFVQNNPLKSLGVAFAAGTLLSALKRPS